MNDHYPKFFDDFIDKTVFLSYNQIGYALRQKQWRASDLAVDLTGQVCLVTGANAGLGYTTTQQLAQRGATVYMVARNQAKGAAAQAEIIEQTGNPNVHLEIADLSRLSDIRALVERLQQAIPRLDILINNAGVLLEDRQLSADGFEMIFATNILGPFLLTNLLIPLMKKSAPARIISVSSGGMYTRKVNVDDLQFETEPFGGVIAYAQSKRAQVILTELWAERLAGSGVTANSMHPGWVRTPGLLGALPTFSSLMSRLLRTPEQGVDTIIWLAMAPHLETESGKFWFDRKVRPTHKTNQTKLSTEERAKLWQQCVELSGLTPSEMAGAK
ncbi:MAG: SDR family oxidoreductase [Chloroflexota bacterium]